MKSIKDKILPLLNTGTAISGELFELIWLRVEIPVRSLPELHIVKDSLNE
jgi:hypothetical protein